VVLDPRTSPSLRGPWRVSLLLGALAVLAAAACAFPPAARASTIPSRMAFTGDSRQLIVVTASSLGSRSGTLRFYTRTSAGWKWVFSATAKLGSSALVDGTRRVEGSHTTPTGIWRIPGYVFGTHAKPAGTRMAYRRITPRSYWTSARTALYNTWVETSTPVPGEHLYGIRAYEYALSTGYNARPNQQVFGRGTAIFLHVNHPGYTSGCVSVSRAAMLHVFRLLDPKKHPRFAVGTTKRGTRTSIYAY
jgi:L,D-peptidoglycan transpeptidase YkuD (ErfK/YbiS/YcfS/YnhG family)